MSPLRRAVRLMKRFENRVNFALFDSDSGIRNFQLYARFVRTRLDSYGDFAFIRELHSIVKHVLKNALDLGLIADQAELLIACLNINLQALVANYLLVTFYGLVDNFARLELLQGRIGVSGV